MAKLKDYGVLNYALLDDYKEPKNTIDTITGLLQFPIVETETYDDGIVINVFEKTLFGKKHRGYLSLLYIDDFKADKSNFIFEPETPIPDFLDILIGLEFRCKYTSYFVKEPVWSYELGAPRKLLLSYGLIRNLIGLKSNATAELAGEELMNDMLSDRALFSVTMMRNSGKVKQLLSFFQKFE